MTSPPTPTFRTTTTRTPPLTGPIPLLPHCQKPVQTGQSQRERDSDPGSTQVLSTVF